MVGSWLRGKRIWDEILSLYRTGAQPSCSPGARPAPSSCLPFLPHGSEFFIFFFSCPFKQEALPYGISQLLQLVVASYLPHKTKPVTPDIWRRLPGEVGTSFRQVGLVFKPQLTLLFWHNQKDNCVIFTSCLSMQEWGGILSGQPPIPVCPFQPLLKQGREFILTSIAREVALFALFPICILPPHSSWV